MSDNYTLDEHRKSQDRARFTRTRERERERAGALEREIDLAQQKSAPLQRTEISDKKGRKDQERKERGRAKYTLHY